MGNAFGAFANPPLSKTFIGAGLSTELGTWIPAGEVVAYVHDEGPADGMHQDVAARLDLTINAALAKCRAGQNDIVVVLPGHTENVDSADDWDNLVAGTTIVGLGTGNNRPTFTWSTATSTVLFDVANVAISNCIFEMAGPSGTTALTVADGIIVSAAGCSISNCKFHTEIDADQGAVFALRTTAAGDDLTVDCCQFYGSGDGTLPTTQIRLVGADRFRMFNSTLSGYTSSVNVGLLQMLTTASTDVHIENCTFAHYLASSVHAATGMAGATGNVVRCNFGILDNATLAGFETEGNLQFFGCLVTNLAGEANAALKTPTSAT